MTSVHVSCVLIVCLFVIYVVSVSCPIGPGKIMLATGFVSLNGGYLSCSKPLVMPSSSNTVAFQFYTTMNVTAFRK